MPLAVALAIALGLIPAARADEPAAKASFVSIETLRLLAGDERSTVTLQQRLEDPNLAETFQTALASVASKLRERERAAGWVAALQAIPNSVPAQAPVAGAGIGRRATEDVSEVGEVPAELRWRLLRTGIERLRAKEPNLQVNEAELLLRADDLVGPGSEFAALVSTDPHKVLDEVERDLAHSLSDVLRSEVMKSPELAALPQKYKDAMAKVASVTAATQQIKASFDGSSNHFAGNIQTQTANLDAGRQVGVGAVRTLNSNFDVQAMRVSEFAATTSTNLRAASGALEALGCHKLAANLDKGAAVIATVGALSAMSTNPMAILPALSGAGSLFGKGGGGDQSLANMQAEILAAIQQLSAQIAANHKEVLAHLDRIEKIGLENQAMLQQIGSAASCSNIVPAGKGWWAAKEDYILDLTKPLRFSSYGALRKRDPNVAQCFKTLNDDFSVEAQLAFFALTEMDVQRRVGSLGKADQQAQVKKLNTYASDLARDIIEPFLTPEARWMFSDPAFTVDELDAKLSHLPPTDVDDEADGARLDPAPFIEWHFREILNPEKVIRLTGYLLAAHPLIDVYEISGQDAVLRSKSELEAGAGGDREGVVRMLKRANTILSLSLNQQAWLSGDVLLPLIDAVEKGDRGGAPKELLDFDPATDAAHWNEYRAKVKTAFAKNGLLQHNLAVYVLRERLQYRPTEYENAYQMHEASGFNQFGGHALDLHYLTQDDQKRQLKHGWYVNLFGTPVELPTPAQFLSGELVQMPAVTTLVRARQRVIADLGGYELTRSGGLDANEYRALSTALAAGQWE